MMRLATITPRSRMSGVAPAWHCSRLLHPRRELRLVEIAFLDVDPARLLAAAAGRNGSQRRAAEEGHLDVAGEDMERHEPAVTRDAIERRVPSHGLAYIGHVTHDKRVQPLADVAFPARHGGDVRPHWSGAVALRDPRVATCEFLCGLRRLSGGPGAHCTRSKPRAAAVVRQVFVDVRMRPVGAQTLRCQAELQPASARTIRWGYLTDLRRCSAYHRLRQRCHF